MRSSDPRFFSWGEWVLASSPGAPRPGPPGTFCADKKYPKNRRTCGPGPPSYLFFVTLRPVGLFFPMSALGRWQSNLRRHSLDLWSSSLGSPPKAHFYSDTTGPPARCGRYCLLCCAVLYSVGPDPLIGAFPPDRPPHTCRGRPPRRPVLQFSSWMPNLRSPPSPTREASSSFVTLSSTSPIEYGPSS